MTPKEKAAEIHEKMFKTCTITMAGAYPIFKAIAKDLSLICVDEMIRYVMCWDIERMTEFNEESGGHAEYWQKVKAEIEAM